MTEIDSLYAQMQANLEKKFREVSGLPGPDHIITRYVGPDSSEPDEFEYVIKDRKHLDNNIGWHVLLDVTRSEWYGYTESSSKNERDGFHNDLFDIRQYTEWSGAEEDPIPEPNFEFRPTGLKMTWYKYPWRAATANMELSANQIDEVFRKCVESVLANNKAW